MADKKIAGKQAILYSATKGALVSGTGALALTDDTWYMINAVAATGSVLPIGEETAIFKSPKNSGDAITPIVGDDVYPLTLSQLCKVDCSINTNKGAIDVTDDCDSGYNSYIPDGYSDISGSISGFLKFNDPTGGLLAAHEDILNRFFDIVDDDGEGGYDVTSKNDDDLILMIHMNSEDADTGDIEVWLLLPVILTGTVTNKPLKGVQNLDLNFQKAQGYASIYQREVVATV
jgi:hypothetical protein